MVNNCFEKCCDDFDLVRKTSQCDRINCFANHDPQFSVYYHKNNNQSCFCFDVALSMIGTIFALLPVNNVKFAKKFLIYFLNYKMPIFLIQIHVFIVLLKIYLINPLHGAFLVQQTKTN